MSDQTPSTQSSKTNRQWLLVNRPSGWPSPSDFSLEESEIPSVAEGSFLARTLYLSVDPYMRGRMRDVASYVPPVALRGVMEGGAVAQIVKSSHPTFQVGDIIEGRFGWQDYAVSNGQGVRLIDPNLAPVSTAVGVLGMPGLTAYFGLLEIGKAEPGETVLVSGAAGAVGSIVGQIAKIKGCRVVGVAGGEQKTRWITESLGFDAAVDYQQHTELPRLQEALQQACPNGVDCYFDNVGGIASDAVFNLLNERARVAICGQISQYNLDRPEQGPRQLWRLITTRSRVEGFIIFDYVKRYHEGLTALAEWIKSGQLQYKETTTVGLENTPQAFIGMMRGKNIGKQVVHVANPV